MKFKFEITVLGEILQVAGTQTYFILKWVNNHTDCDCRFDHRERKGLSPNVLRRTFASELLGRGADIETVRELGGWADLVTVQRYLASTSERKRSAVECSTRRDPPRTDRGAHCPRRRLFADTPPWAVPKGQKRSQASIAA